MWSKTKRNVVFLLFTFGSIVKIHTKIMKSFKKKDFKMKNDLKCFCEKKQTRLDNF